MPQVHLLPTELVNQIAAGEVVERPASVVKELVENALDAGASSIDVLLENGGRRLIEVRDNGCGMSEEDAVLAIQRHATSKIRSFDDLSRVRTLGFRGEALPSIASVSRFSLTTYDGSSSHALRVLADPLTGAKECMPAARDRGTTVSVGELFENVPARRKFLRSSDAEFRSAVTVVTSYALANFQCAFRLEHNGRVVLDLPPAVSPRDRVLQILGRDAGQHLQAIEGEYGGSRLSGFVTRGLRFGTRRNQYFFVNERLVKDRVLTHAATRACEAFDFDGHPAIALFLEVPHESVDVNVHPAKTEVRFRDSGQIHVLVEGAIRRALGQAEEGSALLQRVEDRPNPALVSPQALASQQTLAPPPLIESPPPGGAAQFTPLFQRQPVVQPPTATMSSVMEAPSEAESIPSLGDLQGKVIGQYRLSYILLDTPGGLRIVDQHVAHERVLYDRYWERLQSGTPVSQQLLSPILYECGAAECAALESHGEELRGVGFEMERFSGQTFAISALPPELVRNDLESFLRKLIDASLEEKSSHVTQVRERICASLACQAAIKVHRPLGGEEMARLVSQLLQSSNPYACPHGRPIIVDIRHIDVERHFHRR